MKDRIQQLAKQAQKKVPHGTLSVDQWIETYNRLFAELIINECVEAFQKEKCVRKHFGLPV